MAESTDGRDSDLVNGDLVNGDLVDGRLVDGGSGQSRGAQQGLAHLGIRALRNSVSSVVRRAGQGERIVITVDGKPVAQLGPLQPDSGGLTLDDLAAAGLVEPPRRDHDPTMPAPYPVPADVRLDRLIDQIRGR